MKNFEKYRNNPRNLPTTTARETARETLKQVRQDPGNDFKTSITLPVWQCARFRRLVEIYKERGRENPRQEILRDLVLLLQHRVRRRKCQIHRTKKRNTRAYSYRKVSVKPTPDTYNISHALADHAKISVSYLVDLGLRMYYEVLAQGAVDVMVTLLQADGKKLRKRLRGDTFARVLASGGIYRRSTKSSTAKLLRYGVSVGKPRNKPEKPRKLLQKP